MSGLSSRPWGARANLALVIGGVWLLGLTGCRNNCQTLCQEMADFAEEDCGNTFDADQVRSCMDAYKDVDDDQDTVCEEITPTLREEWTCDDIAEYFDASGGGAAEGTDSGA